MQIVLRPSTIHRAPVRACVVRLLLVCKSKHSWCSIGVRRTAARCAACAIALACQRMVSVSLLAVDAEPNECALDAPLRVTVRELLSRRLFLNSRKRSGSSARRRL